MRELLFKAIADILDKHDNDTYHTEDLEIVERIESAKVLAMDACDEREAINEIIDLIAGFFIKGESLRKDDK